MRTKSKENKQSLSLVFDCFSSNQFQEKTGELPPTCGTRYFSAHAAQFENQRILQTQFVRFSFKKARLLLKYAIPRYELRSSKPCGLDDGCFAAVAMLVIMLLLLKMVRPKREKSMNEWWAHARTVDIFRTGHKQRKEN